MSFFLPQNSKTTIKPKAIHTTVTRVIQKPKPSPEPSHPGYDRERFAAYRRDTPESSSGGSGGRVSGSKRKVDDRRAEAVRRSPVVKKAKKEKEKVIKRKVESSSEASSSADEGEPNAEEEGSHGFEDEDGLVWVNMPERVLFAQGRDNAKWDGFSHSKGVVKRNIGSYHAFFPQDGFEVDGAESEVELEYPASGCKEKFLLLAPPHEHEYSPIGDLMRTIYTIVKTYIPPSHAHVFGALPDDRFSLLQASSLPHLNESTRSSPMTGTPEASTPTLPNNDHAIEEPILRSLQKALNRKDGPQFLSALSRFNSALTGLQSSGALTAHLESKSALIQRSEWENLVAAVGEQVYQRVVGPETSKLKQYVAFSDNVYGELLPRFVTEIINRYKMGPKSVFVDMGSGVGNCLIQAALQAGSPSFGAEALHNPSELATVQIAEAKRRWAMWCLKGNSECEAYEADFCDSEVIAEKLKAADVVLINNYAFTAPLNKKISELFVELKEGTIIISLKPFLPRDFRITERSAQSPLSILRMKEHSYPANSVSWTHEGGKFFEHVIDRRGLENFYKKLVEKSKRA